MEYLGLNESDVEFELLLLASGELNLSMHAFIFHPVAHQWLLVAICCPFLLSELFCDHMFN